MRVTLQFCTYNRAHLLGRVLQACFEQRFPSGDYEVVLVDDGSRDGTRAVIERVAAEATCAFTVVHQDNAGLARARNVGIARARGERIIFIDDDILPTPSLVAEHWRSHVRAPAAIVRGAVINTPDFERLPAPYYTLANYSGNFFWTSNVSVPLASLRAVGAFSERFREYGWEDIELGLRLRAAGLHAVFNRRALVFHHKPPPRTSGIAGILAQARAQARTAVELGAMHSSWRVALATGDEPVQRGLHRVLRALGVPRALAARLPVTAEDRPLAPRELALVRRVASEAYFEELERAARA